MDKSELKRLKARWSPQQTLQGAASLSAESDSSFPVVDDEYIDLRGLLITKILKNAAIKSVDLSGAKLENFAQFSMCRVEKTRFNFASLQTNLGNSFIACDFKSAGLSGAVLRARFEACDFSMADLSGTRGNERHFVGCNFTGTNFRKAILLHCVFEDCKFENCKFHNGSFAFSTFVRSPINDSELGNTLMEKVIFT